MVVLTSPFVSGCLQDVTQPSGASNNDGLAAALELVDASISSETVGVGESVKLHFTVRNNGNQDGAYAVQFLVNGAVEDEKTYRVIGGGSEASTFSFTPIQKGTYALGLAASALGGRATSQVSAGPWEVDASVKANLVIESVDVSAREAEVGTPVAIEARIRNDGEERGTHTFKLYVNGQIAESKDATVDPQSQSTVVFTYTNSARGTYSLRVSEFDAGSIEFYAPATFEALAFTVSETEVDVGDPISFSYDVRNSGDREGSVQVSIVYDGQTVYGKQESIGPRQSKNGQTGQVDATSGGSKTASLALDGSPAKQLQVNVRFPEITVTSAVTPWNSDYACYDHAFTEIDIRNHGSGRGTNVRVEFWIDGSKKSIEMNGATQGDWSLGDLAAGGTASSGEVKILGVTDQCGSTDCHTFVAKIGADHVAVRNSQGIQFCV